MASQSSGRRQPPRIPPDMKAFNRALIAEFRAGKGKLSGPMAGRTLLLLTTMGSKSRQPRTVVLGYGRDGESFVVIASNNGAATDPLWYRNLLANPEATIEVGPQTVAVRARTAEPDERERLTRFVPYVVSQQERTDREIPIVVFNALTA